MFDWFWDFLYGIQKSIQYIIDFIVNTFRVLAGLSPVMIEGDETDILNYFLSSKTIQKSFFLIVMIAVVLLFVFCVIVTIRKQYHEQEQRSYGKILGTALKSALMFLLIPIIFIAANAFLIVGIQQLDLATNPYYEEIINEGDVGYTNISIGGQLLVTLGHDAYIGSESERADIEKKFMLREKGYDYNNLSDVKRYYNLKKLDYFLGLVGGIAILILFALSIIQFIERIFNILLLFLVSPISVSSSVLDDGQRFKLWRDSVISKFLCAYAIIFAVNIFFLIIPIINTINFNVDLFGGVGFSNYLIRLLFILGGAYAVNKSVGLLGNLIQQGLGSQELSDRKNSMLLASGGMHMATNAARSVGRRGAHLGSAAARHTVGRGVVNRSRQHDIKRELTNQNAALKRMERGESSDQFDSKPNYAMDASGKVKNTMLLPPRDNEATSNAFGSDKSSGPSVDVGSTVENAIAKSSGLNEHKNRVNRAVDKSKGDKS